MPYSASVMYPYSAKFDMDYYLKKHMPFVLEKWSPYGLTSYRVISLSHGVSSAGALDTNSTTFGTVALLEWETFEGVGKAIAAEEQTGVLADIKNFSSEGPVFLVGEVVGGNKRK